MNKMSELWRKYLQITVPEEFAPAFERSCFFINIKRFALQSALFLLIDLAWFIYHMNLFFDQWRSLWAHLFVHLVSIFFMLLTFLFFYFFPREDYDANSFWQKNVAVFYQVAYALLEVVHFSFSSADLGSYLKLLSVPFVIALVPVLRPQKSFVLQLLYFATCFYYMTANSQMQSLDRINFHISTMFLANLLLASMLSVSSYYSRVMNFCKQARADKRIQAIDNLEASNSHDIFTGVEHRRELSNYIRFNWEKEKAKGSEINIILLEMDFLQEYNNFFGHLKGDECIAQVSYAIESEVDFSQYMLLRIAGGKFAVVSYNKDHNDVVVLAESIRKKIEQRKMNNSESMISSYVTVSAGVTTQMSTRFLEYKNVECIADKCLYLAKQNGYNKTVHVFGNQKDYRDGNGILLDKLDEYEQRCKPLGLDTNIDDVEKVIREASTDLSYIYYYKEMVLEFSEKAVELLGLPKRLELPTLRNIISCIAEEHKFQHYTYLRNVINKRKPCLKINTVLCLPDQQEIPVRVEARCFFSDSGNLETAEGNIAVMHNFIYFVRFIRQQSEIDAITMLPNRANFQQRLAELIKVPESFGQVILFDIKNFKHINKIYGYSVGDKFLFAAASLLKKLLKDSAQLYNYSVGQYAVILPGKSEEYAFEIVSSVQKYFAYETVKIQEFNFKIPFAIGVVGWKKDDMDVEEIYLALEATMLQAKTDKERNVAFFNKENIKGYLERIKQEKKVVMAAETGFDGFVLYYQPIISSGKQSRVVGAEALIRWQDYDGKIILPDVIIPAIEKAGLIASLECWIFEAVAKQCRKWIQMGITEDFFVQINISTLQIARPTLAKELLGAIDKYRIENSNIVLEVVEGSLIVEMQQAITTLSMLRELGINIAIDDFGTGYCSLSYLRTLPVDEIKIDRSFVKNIENDLMDRELLASIVKLAKSTGKKVCIEGVETAGQAEILMGLSIEYMQGFLFSKPLPECEFYEKYFELQSLDLA